MPKHLRAKYRQLLKHATSGEDLRARAARYRAQINKKTLQKRRVAAQVRWYGVSKQSQQAGRIFSGASRVLLATVKRHSGVGINVQSSLLSEAVCHSVARAACQPGQECLNLLFSKDPFTYLLLTSNHIHAHYKMDQDFEHIFSTCSLRGFLCRCVLSVCSKSVLEAQHFVVPQPQL